MTVSAAVSAEQLVEQVRLFCAQPATAGHEHELAPMAGLVLQAARRCGLDACLWGDAAAPVVYATRSGKSPFTLLLYHHYDVAPTGPWRSWSHEPFQLAERDGALFARGVAHGKGPLAAHLHAIHALLQHDETLPCNIILLVEGRGMAGSSGLGALLREHAAELRADAALVSAGVRDAQGVPFIYSGSKGLLQVRLSVRGPSMPLSAGFAGSVPNPAWRLAWALTKIKGEDEDVRIDGFYDTIDGPSRSENQALRAVQLAAANRLSGWQLTRFLFGMQGVELVRAEVTLPVCNLTVFSCTPDGDLPGIPTTATALLDFQLVPQQNPDAIFQLMRAHLDDHRFEDVESEQLAGGYGPARSSAGAFHQQLADIGATVFGAPPTLLPLGPFTAPFEPLARTLQLPVAAIGCMRESSFTHGPDERLPLADLVQHAQLLIEFMAEQNR